MLRNFIILLIVKNVFSDSCVTYTFEEDFEKLFSNNFGICVTYMKQWNIGLYENTNLTGFHPLSKNFIYVDPVDEISCSSSFLFNMTNGGTIELNVYMEPTSDTDFLYAIVFKRYLHSFDPVVGQVINTSPGWNTLRITLTSVELEPFIGYISLIGRANSESINLIDSFRYIPPDKHDTDCELYLSESTQSIDTTIATTSITDETVTEIYTTGMTAEDIEEETTNPITDDGKCFKTTLYIILIVLLSIILLILYTALIYCLGKRQGKKDILRLVSLVHARSNVIPDNRNPRFLNRINPIFTNNE